VLEHVRNPGNFLDKIYDDLVDGGVLAISTPLTIQLSRGLFQSGIPQPLQRDPVYLSASVRRVRLQRSVAQNLRRTNLGHPPQESERAPRFEMAITSEVQNFFPFPNDGILREDWNW